jgi:hypothetical protein
VEMPDNLQPSDISRMPTREFLLIEANEFHSVILHHLLGEFVSKSLSAITFFIDLKTSITISTK